MVFMELKRHRNIGLKSQHQNYQNLRLPLLLLYYQVRYDIGQTLPPIIFKAERTGLYAKWVFTAENLTTTRCMMMKKNELKQLLFDKCSEYIETRLSTIQSNIGEIQESLTSETKSSAGDKHETGRAMLQLEREKAGQQLAEIENVKNALAQINIKKLSE